MAGTTVWSGNFRDLSASLLRMATLADGGRIDIVAVEKEIERLLLRNQQATFSITNDIEKLDHADWLALQENIDPFDRVQLAYVVQVCRSAQHLSDAGRVLFERSRKEKKMSNDADRLRKYLAKFDLSFAQIRAW